MDTHEHDFDFFSPGLDAVSPSLAVQPQLQDLPPPPPRGRVLVLEDDPLQLKLLEQHLESVGFDVVAASTIRQARQRLSRPGIQLAILDVQLPDGCGFELCEQIDNDPAHAGLPVVVLSSLSEAGAVRKTRASGGRYFLCKPYDPNVLLAIIERALNDL
ncbi:MAG: response regulator [Pirellulaceae bacterium]|jgi:DNA-binding response OmpR family regulator|nr:response regulator [Pirellulaceae bacterium]